MRTFTPSHEQTRTYTIVYYGPGASGKTTNLRWINAHAPLQIHTALHPVALDGERALTLRLQESHPRVQHTAFWELWTLPGAHMDANARRTLLHGAHGIVFIASSVRDQLQENIKSLKELSILLTHHGRSITRIPFVLQYNKRDSPNPLPVQTMNKYLNILDWPIYEACAWRGNGVVDTFTAITRQIA